MYLYPKPCNYTLNLPAQGFDVDNKYGREALERIYADICSMTDGPMPDVPVRAGLEGAAHMTLVRSRTPR